MTGTDISGLLDLNDTIDVRDDNGTYICTFTGKEVLCSFFKFSDGSPFIAAAHQLGPLSNVHIVHPNIPEGETLATSFQKQPAVFIKHHLLDQKVDEEFIRKFLDTFVDAQFIHDIQNCKWDSKTQTLLTKEEQEQDFQVTNLEAQAWYQDVIKQYEQVKDKEMRSKNYAAQEALFDLDEEMSTKTMHEKNDKKATMTGKEEVEVEDVSSDDEAEEVEWTEVRTAGARAPRPIQVLKYSLTEMRVTRSSLMTKIHQTMTAPLLVLQVTSMIRLERQDSCRPSPLFFYGMGEQICRQ
jgi:hypothetical protein